MSVEVDLGNPSDLVLERRVSAGWREPQAAPTKARRRAVNSLSHREGLSGSLGW